MSAPARVADAWRRERFTRGFMLLALASGTTISMAQLATTLYALALGDFTGTVAGEEVFSVPNLGGR